MPVALFEDRLRVLIAEDETIIRLDLRQLLEENGMDVVGEARDGLEAVELARTTNPDVGLFDIKMPNLDGVEAARRVYAERPMPIVMLTAYADAELVDACDRRRRVLVPDEAVRGARRGAGDPRRGRPPRGAARGATRDRRRSTSRSTSRSPRAAATSGRCGSPPPGRDARRDTSQRKVML